MREADNIQALGALSPDYMGMIFWENSARYVTRPVPPSDSIKRVGVFVNPSKEEVHAVVEKHHLDLLQLHGDETPELCNEYQNGVQMNCTKPDCMDDIDVDEERSQ